MILTEIISGRLEKYNYSSNSWVQIMELNNSNVYSAGGQRQCTNDDTFTIGGCFSATMNITLKLPPSIGSFQLRGCRITLSSSIAGGIGVFFVTNVGKRVGRIFSLSCHDSVIWTETSSYSDAAQNLVKGVLSMFPTDYSVYLQGWMDGERLTGYTNQFIESATGYKNLLGFDLYHLPENDGIDVCNAGTMFSIYRGSGKADTDCPRDVYKMIAEMSFGFVYAEYGENYEERNGRLTLGQFAEPRFGVAEIFENEIEYDSGEFADYRCILQRVTMIATSEGGETDGYSTTLSGVNYQNNAYFGITVKDNPFLDRSYQLELIKGNSGRAFLQSMATNLYNSFHRSQNAFRVSPFKCTVHGVHTFHLGQKVLIHYSDYDGTQKIHDSIITKICWTLNGGQTIMCCGGDTRALTDALKVSKGDKVLRDLQAHCNAIERRTVGLSQAEYDALSEYDSHTLYCII